MKKTSSDARTLSEWWNRRYTKEHWIVGILLGFLLGALIDLPVRYLLVGTPPCASAKAATSRPLQRPEVAPRPSPAPAD